MAEQLETPVEEKIVVALYRTLLGRPPDKIGLKAHAKVIKEQGIVQGLRITLINFLSSDEYQDRQRAALAARRAARSGER